MKISEMTTEQAQQAICMMAEPIGRIGADEEFAPMLLDIGTAYKTNRIMAASVAIAKAVPFLLKKHEADTYVIVAAMTLKTDEEIKKQNFLSTVKAVKDFFDRDFVELFTSSVQQARND